MIMIISQDWLKSYIRDVENGLCQKLASQGERFSSYDDLLRKFRIPSTQIIDEQYQSAGDLQQWQMFKKLIENHNELCVAYHILFQQKDSRFVNLEYEPKTQSTSKRIDFRATTDADISIWIEVKTIHPDNRWLRAQGQRDKENELEKRDWEQYQRWQQYFPPMASLVISRDADGPDIWHDKTAARTHMLEYALEFEERIAELSIDTKNKFILTFVGNGFDWRLDELEDFVAFYKIGKHLPGDVLQDIEAHDIKVKNIALARSINRFAYFQRREVSVQPEIVIWNVKPPVHGVKDDR